MVNFKMYGMCMSASQRMRKEQPHNIEMQLGIVWRKIVESLRKWNEWDAKLEFYEINYY